ncbi:GNAT family N-acetyltransferase [Microbacterium gorillae]|uniref:GNAT family N-acetyltransferase n=1 Tax=Microbacterium gorillae TaxID=1231063 RepID=UPI0006937800|nr:GNAT family N-acetyltransferase [Microbacterium gorillae]
MDARFSVRPTTADDAEELTELLHLAYGEHLVEGLNFTAATQSVQTTRHRCAGGGSWVVVAPGGIRATATMSLPPSSSLQKLTAAAREPRRAWLNQVAVHPELRGTGLASVLFHGALEWARDAGARSVGVDTAEPATALVGLYEHWGFTRADTVHWHGKTYDSTVLIRSL